MIAILHSIERIRAFARARGWTKSRLARQAGMIDTTLRDFHKDDWNPTAETLRRLEAVIPEDFDGDAGTGAYTGSAGGGAGIDSNLVRKLAALLEETGLAEIEYGAGEWHLRVAKGTAPPPLTVVTPPPSAPAETAGEETADDVSNHPGVVVSPMVGVVYTANEPDGPPFVNVGDTVEDGQTLMLIEAMKVFNQIKAPKAGKITRILVGNGTPVEFGEPLLIIE